jgi:hypothetical protein
MLYRRFGYLQARVLLDKQEHLRGLEAQLDELDQSQRRTDPDALFRREGQGDCRRELLRTIEKTFNEYGQTPAFCYIVQTPAL